MEFSVRSMKTLIQENTEKRVSDGSAETLGEFLDNWGKNIGQEALEKAREDDRKTVRAEDIRQVLRDRKERDVDQRLSI